MGFPRTLLARAHFPVTLIGRTNAGLLEAAIQLLAEPEADAAPAPSDAAEGASNALWTVGRFVGTLIARSTQRVVDATTMSV